MRLPNMSENEFSLETANKDAWMRARNAIPFAGVKILSINPRIHIANGKTCHYITTNIVGNPELLEQVEHWIKTGS